MLKKSVSLILASSLAIGMAPIVMAGAEETENNAVSGYVTTSKSGFELVSGSKTPVIHIDSDEYESVIRAASDLSGDIENVTGVKPVTSSDDITTPEVGASGIVIGDNGMEISLDYPVSSDLESYIAVYDRNGALTGLAKSTGGLGGESFSDGSVLGFKFDKVLEKPAGGSIKGYIWDKNMNPVTESLDMLESSSVSLSDVDIVIGTLGMSETIDALASSGELNVSEIEGKWESFTIQNVDDTLVIAGSDKRGTIYGIYDVCEKMGVSPWKWWSDVDPAHADSLHIDLPDGGYTEGEPSVKYRGIFINDEYNLSTWSKSFSSDGTAMNHETYEKVFELLLRLKANYLWPAMHAYSPAFHSDEENAKLADEYGIVMGSSHCEPLLRNNLGELDAFQEKWESENPDKTLYKALTNETGTKVAYYWTDYDNNNKPVDNKEFLEAYWRESVQKYGEYENVYSLGMRGVHDGSFQTNMDYATALNEIIACQRKIIKEEICDKTGQDITDIPQVFIPYKDVLKYYNSGQLQIPEDVTIMWTDDNYGYVRQNADDTERENSGRTGIYYHISYYGYPTSYLWLTTTQPGLIREEMGKSYDMGADKMWILNVGDIKPAENDIEYFMKLARNIDIRNEDISDIFAAKAQRDFNLNDSDAEMYAEIMDEYYELSNSKRPEFIRSGEISVTAYGDEGQRYLDRCKALTAKAEKMYSSLDEDKKDSFYELTLYPIRSFTNMMIDYIQTDRANLYAEQGRGTAPYQYAEEAAEAAAQIETDTEAFNSLRDGKWNNIMNINPSKLQSCDAHITTELNASKPTALDYTALAVAVDSQTSLDDERIIDLSVYDTYNKFIDIINQGYGTFDYTVTSDADYINFSKISGTVNGSDRVYISLDKTKQIPSGNLTAVITVSQKLGDLTVDSKEITVNISNPAVTSDEKMYIEAGGTVSIEAENYSNAVANGVYEWKTEKDFGRSGDSVKAYPDMDDNVEDPDASNSAYLEYDIYFENSGTYTLDVYRMPTLNERNNMRFAVGIDDSEPEILKGTSVYSGSQNKSDAWARGVLDNTQKLRTTVNVSESGKHTLKLYNVSPGVVIDKMVLTQGTDVTESYFGAPESYNTTYNTVMEEIPSYTDKAAEADIEKLYEPDILIGNVRLTDTENIDIPLIKLTDNYDSAVAAVTGYDAQGNMTAVGFAKADLSGTAVNSQLNVPVSVELPSETTAYAVTVFDSFTNMQLIAPYKKFGTIVTEAEGDSIAIKTDLSDYIGKKSITLIADREITEDIAADNIKYLYGEDVTTDSYKYIPFAGNADGVYYMRTGISGEETIDEVKNTIINITPDNDGVRETLNKWSFNDSLADDAGNDPFTVSGGASLADGRIKLNSTSSGNAAVTYSDPVTVSQGGTVTVEFDIYYGRNSGKSTSYSISDSNGKELASVKLCAYDPSSNASVMIGGNEMLTSYTELSDAVSRANNTAEANGATHYKNVFDFGAGRAYITVSSSKGTAEFSGKLGDTANNIGTIAFSSNHVYDERASLVDDVTVSTQTAPQYEITIKAVSKSDIADVIENAVITVTDALTNAEITPNNDGNYMLCEGDYIITTSAGGYRTAQMTLELTPALASKTVNVEMVSDTDLTPARATIKYVDEEGNSLKEDTVVDEDVYVGDIYTIPNEMTADFTVENDEGKIDLYQFNESKSQTKTELTADTEMTLVFNLSGQYDYYEDFENYEVNNNVWTNGSGTYSLTVANDNSKYLSYSCTSGSSVGSYTTFDEINCEGKTVKIEADLKFSPSSITGDSQFSIGNSSPSFSSNKISYGFENSAGHIIGLVHKKSSASFLVNGESISTGLIGDWVHLEADADFVSKKVTVKLTNDKGYSAEVKDVSFYSSSVDDNIGSMYVRAASGNGNVGVDNLRISITGDGVPAEPEIPSALNYKSVYAFGDSIVYGHNAPGNAFMNLIANKYSMSLTKYAKNGATVMDSGNDIIAQVNGASSEEPDFIVFDGYTNDAYGPAASDSFNSSGSNPDVTQHLGVIQSSGAESFDNTTFCGAFEEILYTMKNKWPNSKIVYVTIHKSGARDFEIQTQLHDLAVEMCEKWGVEVVDMFNDCDLDTRDPEQMAKYIINGAGSHPNVVCCEEYYVPMIVDKMTELCE